jgi:hypothetical protein
MKLLLLLLLAPMLCAAQNEKAFRNIKWGMTKAQVIQSGKGKPTSQDGELMYDIAIDGYKFTLVYYFESNKLAKAVLLYSTDHSSSETYYESFLAIAGRMDTKYGSHSDLTVWKDDLYKSSPKKWGFACSAGHVKFAYSWSGFANSNVMIIMNGDNFKITLGVIYADAAHINKEETGF